MNLDVYAQNNSTSEIEKQSSLTNTTQDKATVTVTKIVRCDSSLGIPNDDAICQFVLDNVDSNQFNLIVTGNESDSTNIQGSENGTKFSTDQGNYTVSETPFDTMDIENQLGESAVVTMMTDVNGDCSAQFGQLDTFQNATGTIISGESQNCEIINTISVSQGASPEEP